MSYFRQRRASESFTYAQGKILKLGREVQKRKLGLWGELTVRLLDVNAHGLDKKNRKFVPYAIPRDCKER